MIGWLNAAICLSEFIYYFELECDMLKLTVSLLTSTWMLEKQFPHGCYCHFSISKTGPVRTIKHFQARTLPHKINTDRSSSIEISPEKARQLNILTAPAEPSLGPQNKKSSEEKCMPNNGKQFLCIYAKSKQCPSHPTCGAAVRKVTPEFSVFLPLLLCYALLS